MDRTEDFSAFNSSLNKMGLNAITTFTKKRSHASASKKGFLVEETIIRAT